MIFASILVGLVYLLPVAVVLVARARRERPIIEVACDVPLAVAADLAGVLLLSRVLTLEWAAVVSRVLWLAGGAAVVARRRKLGDAPVRPAAVTRAAIAQAAALGVAGLLTSLRLSRPCAIWDREWHIPLVSSLRGQKLPFANVFEPKVGLYYHFSGDVLASMLQAFSGNALHASLALSLAHDLVFLLLGVELALVLWAVGVRRLAPALVVLAATLLAGPVTLLRDPNRKLELGYSIVNYLSLSFRPHVSLGYLLAVGFAGAVAGAVMRRRTGADPRRLLPALAATAAILAVTDEAALGVLGLGLGAAWLADPESLAPARRQGAIVLAGLALTLIAALVIFVGAVGPGAPHYPMRFLAPRSPGFMAPPLSLGTGDGLSTFLQDLLPVVGVLAAGLMLLRRAARDARVLVLFYGVAVLFSCLAFSCVEYNKEATESHRWITTVFVIGPLLLAAWLAPPPDAGELSRPAPWTGWPALVAFVCVGLGVASTVEWLGSGLADKVCTRDRYFESQAADKFYELNCRAVADSHLGERARATYADAGGLFIYAGCRPTFVAGPPAAGGMHKIKAGRPQFGKVAIDDLNANMLTPDASLPVACLKTPPTTDPICAHAKQKGRCAPVGEMFDVCELAPADRRF